VVVWDGSEQLWADDQLLHKQARLASAAGGHDYVYVAAVADAAQAAFQLPHRLVIHRGQLAVEAVLCHLAELCWKASGQGRGRVQPQQGAYWLVALQRLMVYCCCKHTSRADASIQTHATAIRLTFTTPVAHQGIASLQAAVLEGAPPGDALGLFADAELFKACDGNVQLAPFNLLHLPGKALHGLLISASRLLAAAGATTRVVHGDSWWMGGVPHGTGGGVKQGCKKWRMAGSC
jgi:hypothetical protein